MWYDHVWHLKIVAHCGNRVAARPGIRAVIFLSGRHGPTTASASPHLAPAVPAPCDPLLPKGFDILFEIQPLIGGRRALHLDGLQMAVAFVPPDGIAGDPSRNATAWVVKNI